MDSLGFKYQKLTESLVKLDDAIKAFDSFSMMGNENQAEYQALSTVMLDHFKFSVEQFWKYLKMYEETIAKQPAPSNGADSVIRAAFNAALISQAEMETALRMIKVHDEVANVSNARQLALHIPAFYQLMLAVSQRHSG